MPKISTTTITVDTDRIKESFPVEVNYYTKESSFAIDIPASMFQAFDLLGDADRKQFNGGFYSKHKYSHPQRKRVVYGDTEATAISNARKLFEKLAESSIKERKVIIVFYDGRNTNRNHHTSDGYHPRGLEFGLTFCVEVSVSDGKKRYYQYREYESSGKTNTAKKEISIWNSNSQVVDDTEKNREFLTSLYAALKTLSEKMAEFTKSEQSVLDFIESRQKLLQ